MAARKKSTRTPSGGRSTGAARRAGGARAEASTRKASPRKATGGSAAASRTEATTAGRPRTPGARKAAKRATKKASARPRVTAAESQAQEAERRARAIITPAFVRRGARAVTDDDVVRVVSRATQISKLFTEAPLRRFKEDGRLLVAMLSDYWSGRYRQVPWNTVAAVTFALLYALSPIDLIPDFLPGIGHVDDALLLGACLVMAERDVRRYRKWAER